MYTLRRTMGLCSLITLSTSFTPSSSSLMLLLLLLLLLIMLQILSVRWHVAWLQNALLTPDLLLLSWLFAVILFFSCCSCLWCCCLYERISVNSHKFVKSLTAGNSVAPNGGKTVLWSCSCMAWLPHWLLLLLLFAFPSLTSSNKEESSYCNTLLCPTLCSLSLLLSKRLNDDDDASANSNGFEKVMSLDYDIDDDNIYKAKYKNFILIYIIQTNKYIIIYK